MSLSFAYIEYALICVKVCGLYNWFARSLSELRHISYSVHQVKLGRQIMEIHMTHMTSISFTPYRLFTTSRQTEFFLRLFF